tara:strand:- start:622 stop:960 length:339 start_codon:yes stop_codon:yes gene_type:complete
MTTNPITPPQAYVPDLTIANVTERPPSFGSLTNLDAAAQLSYGVLASNIESITKGFQKSFEWELRQAEIKWKNDQRLTINEFEPALMNREQLLANTITKVLEQLNILPKRRW